MQNYTEIQIAARNRDWNLVISLAKTQDTDKEDTLRYGDALLEAVQCHPSNVKEIVEILLNAHAPTHWRYNDTKNSPLHFAAHYGNTELVKLLLEHGASLSKKNLDKKTPIQLAADNRQWATVMAITKFRRTGYDTDYYHYAGALITAIIYNPPEVKNVVEALLDAKAHTTWVAGPKQNTALHLATLYSNNEVIQLLIDHGADLSVKNLNDITPIEFAVKMAKADEDWSSVIMIAQAENTDTNDNLHYGSALIEAVDDNQIHVVEILLKANASTTWNHTDTNNSPLHLAIIDKNTEMVKLLIQNGANLFAKNRNKETPFEIAYNNADWPTINIIALYKHCNCTNKDLYEKALLKALQKNKYDTIQALLMAETKLFAACIKYIDWTSPNAFLFAQHMFAEHYSNLEDSKKLFHPNIIDAVIRETLARKDVPTDQQEHYQKLCYEIGLFYFNTKKVDDYINALTFFILAGNFADIELKAVCFLAVVELMDIDIPYEPEFSLTSILTKNYPGDSKHFNINKDSIKKVIDQCLPYLYKDDEICNTVGEFYFYLGNYHEAFKYWKIARKTCQQAAFHITTTLKQKLKLLNPPPDFQLVDSVKVETWEIKLKSFDAATVQKKLFKYYYKKGQYLQAARYTFKKNNLHSLSYKEKKLFLMPEVRSMLDTKIVREIMVANQTDHKFITQSLILIFKNASLMSKFDALTVVLYFLYPSYSVCFTPEENKKFLLDFIANFPDISLASPIYEDIENKLNSFNLTDRQLFLEYLALKLSNTNISKGEIEELQTKIGERHFKTLFTEVVRSLDIHQNLIVKAIYAHILIHKDNRHFSDFILQFRAMNPSPNELHHLFSLIDANKTLSSLEKYEWKGIIRQYALHLMKTKTSSLPIQTKIAKYNEAAQQPIFVDNRRFLSNFFSLKTNAVIHLETVKSIHELNEFTENEKIITIDKIKKNYSPSLFSSNESKALLTILNDNQINNKTKIEKTSSYLTLNNFTKGKLVNQDKKLFKVIKSKLEEVSASRKHVSR
jgi:ankyrin repeat protein